MQGIIPLVIAAHSGNSWTTVLLAGCFFILNNNGYLSTDLGPVFDLVRGYNFKTMLPIRALCDAVDKYQLFVIIFIIIVF
jgi:hypothetical protein